MTYCLAMRLHDGLVFLSDTRTNAGVDNIGTYRKQHVISPAADRVFVIESAGNLGRVSRQVAAEHEDALPGVDATATFILGGQIAGEDPDILLVYPEGNYIRASDELPFLQIGEAKYGKFLLEMAATLDVDPATATKIALGSMMSTARANLSVGPPYDLGLYTRDSFAIEGSGSRRTPRCSSLSRRRGNSSCARASLSCRASRVPTWPEPRSKPRSRRPRPRRLRVRRRAA